MFSDCISKPTRSAPLGREERIGRLAAFGNIFPSVYDSAADVHVSLPEKPQNQNEFFNYFLIPIKLEYFVLFVCQQVLFSKDFLILYSAFFRFRKQNCRTITDSSTCDGTARHGTARSVCRHQM